MQPEPIDRRAGRPDRRRCRFNLRPDLPDFALFPRAEWLAREPRVARSSAANTTSPTASRSGRTSCGARSRTVSRRTRGRLADFGRVGVFAGSTQALLHARVGAPRGGHETDRRRGSRASLADARRSPRPDSRRVPVPVDEHGLRVERPRRTSTPSSSAPIISSRSASSLSPERRRAARRVGGRRRSAGDRARLRRALPLRPPPDGGAPGAGAGARRVRRHGERRCSPRRCGSAGRCCRSG